MVRPLATHECIKRIPVFLAELRQRHRTGIILRPGLEHETPLGLLELAGSRRYERD